MSKNYTLHDLPKEEMPRERLRKVGVDNLSLQELLALIIEKGRKNNNVLTISQNLLANFGNLQNIKEASLKELQKVKGIGFATACKLKAAIKLGEKTLIKYKQYGNKIVSTEDVFKLLKNEIGDKKKEHFVVLSLDSRKKLIDIDEISIGTINASLAHPREIFISAIRNSATSIILAHNHPSNDSEFSENDELITKKIIKAGKYLGINLLDHVIITEEEFSSYKNVRNPYKY